MSLLTPLGLLALLAIIVLLLIYLIKPTYQNKVIGSTFLWRNSLKFKRNKRPVSKLVNILLIIVQMLIIVDISFILSTTFINIDKVDNSDQSIYILDSSASMNTKTSITRFERAKNLLKEKAKKDTDDNKQVSIINMNKDANYIVNKELNYNNIVNAINGLEVSYDVDNIKESVKLVNETLKTNPNSEIILLTDKDYTSHDDIEVINVREKNDYNNSILDVNVNLVDNYYEFDVETMTVGKDNPVTVSLSLKGINEKNEDKTFTKRVNNVDSVKSKVSFKDLEVYEFKSAEVTIKSENMEEDSFNYDDSFFVPTSKKEILSIQYYSTKPNNFVYSAINTIANKNMDFFDFDVKQTNKASELKSKGFDFYIYEHEVPTKLPSDGTILIIDPDKLPSKLGVSLGDTKQGNYKFSNVGTHDITNKVDASKITAVEYKPLEIRDEATSLMKYEEDDVLVVNDKERAIILSLNLNKSNLPLLIDFPLFMNNVFDYFIKPVTSKSVFNVNEGITFNTRGKALSINIDGNPTKLDTPIEVKLNKPGIYTLTETLLSTKRNKKEIFVRIDKNESLDIKLVNNDASELRIFRDSLNQYDIYLYLSIALLVLILIERLLSEKKKA